MRASTSCWLQKQQFLGGHCIRNTSGHTQVFSPSTRDTRLHDAQDGQESPCNLHAPGVALRHAFCHPPITPRHASSEKQQFLFSVEPVLLSAGDEKGGISKRWAPGAGWPRWKRPSAGWAQRRNLIEVEMQEPAALHGCGSAAHAATRQ
jgi:hypothetical protein